jgi:lipopolysaccharide/colanic/teichoic acid biosynthesis glycosyltransferase
LKRWLDAVCSVVGLIVVLPLLLLIAAAIKLESRGPVIYSSSRIGRKGRTFLCYKFRTMSADAEELKVSLQHLNERDGVLFKITNDPRITRLGRFLRKYSLDELPQFWNVLKGDMSMVGPRPPLADEVQQYELEHLRRLDVLPGITGLWQVESRCDPSFASYISLDVQYVERWHLLLDFKILFKTILVVIAGSGQ